LLKKVVMEMAVWGANPEVGPIPFGGQTLYYTSVGIKSNILKSSKSNTAPFASK
jgi:hypothetical protein